MEALKDSVKTLLETNTNIPVFYREADKDAKYPYFVFAYRRIDENNGIERYEVEVNGWDQNRTSSRIEAKLDAMERAVHTLKHMDDDRVLIMYMGRKEPVDDEDKSIKRIREQFEMTVCERR